MFSAHLKTIQKLLNSLVPQNLQTKLHIKSSHIVYSHHVSLGDILWSVMVPVFLWLDNFVEYLVYMSFSWCFLIIWFRYTYLPGKFRRELYCFQCILTRGSWCVTLQGRLTLISQLGWHPHLSAHHLIPGLGRSPGGGHSNPFQYSCLENPHGQRSLTGYSSWGHKESDVTEAT